MHKIFKSKSRNSGFTLVELLVVVAIIGILAGILMPVLGKARENARKSTCQSNLKQIGLALTMYADEHGEMFPQTSNGSGSTSLSVLYNGYVTDAKVFRCQSGTLSANAVVSTISAATDTAINSANGDENWTQSYAYDSSKGASNLYGGVAVASDFFSDYEDFTEVLSPNHGYRGGNVLFVDGHVEWLATHSVYLSTDPMYDDNIFTGSRGNGTDSVLAYGDD